MEAQKDEILALSSILSPEEIVLHDPGGDRPVTGCLKVVCQLRQPVQVNLLINDLSSKVSFLPPVVLHFVLPDSYPLETGPEFNIECIWLEQDYIQTLEREMKSLFVPEEVVLFTWFDQMKTWIDQRMEKSTEITCRDID
jgi:hypothetical protein